MHAVQRARVLLYAAEQRLAQAERALADHQAASVQDDPLLAQIRRIFGVTQEDLDGLEAETGWLRARAQAEAERQHFLAWATAKQAEVGRAFTHVLNNHLKEQQ